MTPIGVLPRPPTLPTVVPSPTQMRLRVRTPYSPLFVNRNASQVTILAIGDSITEQTWTGLTTTRWTNVLQGLLRGSYPTTGIGSGGGVGYQAGYDHSGIATDDTTIAGSTIKPVTGSPGYKGIAMASGSSVTFPARTCTSIRVWYSAMNQAGVLSVTVDGGTPILIPTTRDTIAYHDHWFDIHFGSSASRVVVVAFYAAGPGFFPNPTFGGVQYFDGDEGSGTYLALPGPSADTGNQASTPDNAAFDMTGANHTFRAKFRATDPTGGGVEQYLINRGDSLANKRCFILCLSATGLPKLYYSTNGTAYSNAVSTGSALTAGQDYWLEAKLVRNNGANATIDFRISTDEDDLALDDGDDVTGWVAHGSQILNASIGVLFATDQAIRVGAGITGLVANGEFAGRVYAAQVKDGSSTVVSPVWAGTTARYLYDTQGNLWTAGAGAVQTVEGTGKGIHVINAGKSGARPPSFTVGEATGDFPNTGYNISDVADWFRSPVSLVSIAVTGMNDYLNNIDPEDFRGELGLLVEIVRAAQPNVPLLFPIWWEPYVSTPKTYDYDDYAAIVYDTADTYGNASVEDFREDWPQPSVPGFPGPTDPSGYYIDGIHPSTAGHAAIAARLFETVSSLLSPGRVMLAGTDERPRIEFAPWSVDLTVARSAIAAVPAGSTMTTEAGDDLATEAGDLLGLES